MKKRTRNFLYFVLIAPILAKIVEWLYQLMIPGGIEFIKQFWLFQIISIVAYSLGVYGVMKLNKSNGMYKMTFIVAIAYFLKEVYNLIFITKILSQGTIIALTLEPVFMWVLLGYIPYKLIFKEGKK